MIVIDKDKGWGKKDDGISEIQLNSVEMFLAKIRGGVMVMGNA